MHQVEETEISGEEEGVETISTFILSEFQTVIKTEPDGIFEFCKRHFLKLTVIFTMHVRVNVIS